MKLPHSQFNKQKSGIKDSQEVTLKIQSNNIGNYNNENHFPHNLLLTNTQVSRLRKVFSNSCWANIKLWNTQLHKIGKPGGFLGQDHY